ncbi:MAG TPA: c-type cytochrome [Steroidobacteraceae bacterium]|nr:c-type cytochrome [Steroidobacteraceae bacterium]
MVFAVVVVLLVIGTVAFHFLSPWWFTPIASNWEAMDQTVNVTFWVTGIVFVLVNLFMAYAVVKYRHRKDRPGQTAHYEPENKKLEWWLTGITSVGIAAMLAPGLAVWAKFVTPPDTANAVEVMGQQWNWSYRLPGKDGAMGLSDNRLVSITNPFGLDPKDPKGQDDILIANPELHLPLNYEVKMLLRSIDVNHQFAVPQFRVKMDMVPGMVTTFWFKTTRTGSFDALCEQLCGLAHFAMRGRVLVESDEEYQTWLAKQPTFAQMQAASAGDPAIGQAHYAVCSACHGAQGEGNRDLNAPKLAGQAPWYLIRQLQAFKNGVRGGPEDKNEFAQQMAPMAMTLPDDAAVKNVVAYITSLQDSRPTPTVFGNPQRGKRIYENCTACHGASGQGIWATHAPRLSSMSDWYLKRQLETFKEGGRGVHRMDFYGSQMASMAKPLQPDAINDVVDYMHNL